MKISELHLEDLKIDIQFAKPCVKGSHSKDLFKLGCAIPTCTNQLKKFTHLDVLCGGDVIYIGSIFPNAEFKYTKSKGFVRLTNFLEFKKVLTAKIISNETKIN